MAVGQSELETGGVHHLAIQVVSLARVEPFYTQVLGLPVLRRWPFPEGEGERSIWVDTGDGSFLALEVFHAGPGMAASDVRRREGPGPFLVALRVRRGDREAWRARLQAAGVIVERESPFTLYVRDPEGNPVGLSHWPEAVADEG
jgi:hypothetical protein